MAHAALGWLVRLWPLKTSPFKTRRTMKAQRYRSALLLYCFVIAAGAQLVVGSTAIAQAPGEVLWTVDLKSTSYISSPTLGPDGTIYVHAGALYAISPDGVVLWSQPLTNPNSVSVGADGTVYAGSQNTIYAFSPLGELLWSFTEEPRGQGIMVGPSVGADGNIYVITDLDGLGAFSLTPQGQLRWNVPGFRDGDGVGLGPVALASDRLYFAEDEVPGCGLKGLISIDFSGQIRWCRELSGERRPVAAPNDNAYHGAIAYSPDGLRLWAFEFPGPLNGLIGPGVGPDNAIYMIRNASDLWAINPDGTERWRVDVSSDNFPVAPAVLPDNRAIVIGYSYGFGVNGSVRALSAADGALLWSIPISGPSAGAGAPASFSADGQVAYVPVWTNDNTVDDQLWAVFVGGGEAPSPSPAPSPEPEPDPELAVSVEPQEVPVEIAASGGRIEYSLSVSNNGATERRVDIWITVTDPFGSETMIESFDMGLKAGQTEVKNFQHDVEGSEPAGTYTLAAFAGTFPDGAEATDSFTFTKLEDTTQDATALRTGSPFGEEGAGSEVPQEFELLQNYPNPFNPTTEITFGLPEAGRVRLMVFDVLGREVARPVDGGFAAGRHRVRFDTSALPSGTYLYRIEAGGASLVRRMTLLK